MNQVVLGPGGVGGLIAAVLARAGESVVVVPRRAFARPEIAVSSPFGSFTVPVTVSKLVEDCDLLWVTVKAPALDAALAAVPAGVQVGHVLPLLNGIDHLGVLRARFGDDRVIAATIAVESESTEPGVVVQRSPFCRLRVSSSGRPFIDSTLAHLERFGFECTFVDDEKTLMWGKLAFLAPIALATAGVQGPVGVVRDDPALKAQLIQMVGESCAVATRDGATVDAEAAVRWLMGLPGEMRSSMQKDVAAGRVPELDAIAGPVLRLSQAYGIPVPATRAAVERVRKLAHFT